MLFSLLLFGLTVRAVLRCSAEKFAFGVVGGATRAVLMLAGAYLALQQTSYFLLPGNLVVRRDVSASSALIGLLTLLVLIVGPLLSVALVVSSWKRFKDAPAAQEQQLRRPFSALLPVAVLDVTYVVFSVGLGVLNAEPGL